MSNFQKKSITYHLNDPCFCALSVELRFLCISLYYLLTLLACDAVVRGDDTGRTVEVSGGRPR